jgi:hypothetical protein
LDLSFPAGQTCIVVCRDFEGSERSGWNSCGLRTRGHLGHVSSKTSELRPHADSTASRGETKDQPDPIRIPGLMRRVLSPWLPLLVLLTAVLTIGILRLDREISFYDEGVYVINAKSLATGAGYKNLSLPDSPPQGKYPPFFPFLLSLVWRMLPDFPANLVALKALVLLMGLGLLAVTYGYLRTIRRLDSLDSLAVVAIIGLNPFFLFFSTIATSDIPYALLSLLALFLYERSSSGHGNVIFGLMLVLAVLAFLTRIAGIFLLTAIVADLLRQHRFRRATITAILSALVVGLWTLWSQWATVAYAQYPDAVRGNYAGYVAALSSSDWIRQLPKIIAVNLAILLNGWRSFLFPRFPVIVGVLILPVVYFFFKHFRPRLLIEEFYCVLYVMAILMVPYPDTARYLLAISPFLISYFVAGFRSVVRNEIFKSWPECRARKAGYVVVAGFVLVVLVIDFGLEWVPHGQRTDGTNEFHRMLDWISQNVPPDAILVGDYDPAYYLFTGRKAIHLSVNMMIYYANEVPRDFPRAIALLESFQRMKACYIIRDPLIGGLERIYYHNLVERFKEVSHTRLSQLYENPTGEYALYKQSGCP